jgi:hypothetical protein
LKEIERFVMQIKFFERNLKNLDEIENQNSSSYVENIVRKYKKFIIPAGLLKILILLFYGLKNQR